MHTKKVYKKTLSNGLTILVAPQHVIPKVSVQLWYNVGSKDELSGEKGIAHLIEHMIFKGTNSLSESDINMITQKLSGYCNAFTSHDYTGYMFDFPSQNWHESLVILADCMSNCRFNPEMLSSELKAVIQELKMYNDDFGSSLVEKMLGSMFPDHPYHHPIIGYKQDLWNLNQETLVHFYKKHYIPNNATLVITGDVLPDEAFTLAEKNFGSIPANSHYKKDEFYHSTDIAKQHISLYRDIKVPVYISGWIIPGLKEKRDYISELFSSLFASGMGSRLYTKLVNELELATDIDCFTYDLFDKSAFFISVEPSEGISQEIINSIIIEELDSIRQNSITEKELLRATRKIEMEYLSILENSQKQAYSLGKYYTALADEEYLYTYADKLRTTTAQDITEFVRHYLRETVMYTGSVVKFPENEREFWLEKQNISDQEDAKILSKRDRSLAIEPGRKVVEIVPGKAKQFAFPCASSQELSNGLKVISYHNPDMPKLELILDLKAKHVYDPEDKEGLLNFMADMLLEGTSHHSAEELAQLVESYGMSLTTAPGRILMTMLSQDFSIGLDILNDILTSSTFNLANINKVRNQLITELQDFWDNPAQFLGQLAREYIYKGHPYSKNILGTKESLTRITQDDLVHAYKAYMTPKEAVLIIVGDLQSCNIMQLLEEKLGMWHGPTVETVAYPPLEHVAPKTISHSINRDQIVLGFCGLSVDRKHQDYDKLLLFDQIFTGGVLGSMNSRLFALREQSGLFYTIGGSLISNSDRQPGMIAIKTIVSNDRLSEAETSIEYVINTAIESLNEQELQEAKQAIINSLVDNFATNKHTAVSLLFLEIFKLDKNYFDTRALQIDQITLKEVQDAVKRYLNTDRMIKLRIGRVE